MSDSSIRWRWASDFTSMIWAEDSQIGAASNPFRVVVMDRPIPMWAVPRNVLGPIHRCGSQEYYPAWWNEKPEQCAPCHRRQVAKRQREWREEQRLKRVRARVRTQYIVNTLHQIVTQLGLPS